MSNQLNHEIEFIEKALNINPDKAAEIQKICEYNRSFKPTFRTQENFIETSPHSIKPGVYSVPFCTKIVNFIASLTSECTINILHDGSSHSLFDGLNVNFIKTKDVLLKNLKNEILFIFSDLYFGIESSHENVTLFDLEANFSIIDYYLARKNEIELFFLDNDNQPFRFSKNDALNEQEACIRIARSIERYIRVNYNQVIDWKIYQSKTVKNHLQMKKILQMAYEGFVFNQYINGTLKSSSVFERTIKKET